MPKYLSLMCLLAVPLSYVLDRVGKYFGTPELRDQGVTQADSRQSSLQRSQDCFPLIQAVPTTHWKLCWSRENLFVQHCSLHLYKTGCCYGCICQHHCQKGVSISFFADSQQFLPLPVFRNTGSVLNTSVIFSSTCDFVVGCRCGLLLTTNVPPLSAVEFKLPSVPYFTRVAE